jgi:hypothetical protein
MNIRNRPALFVLTQTVVLVVMMAAPASQATGQARPGETVIQKATDQFEDSPLTITSLSQRLYVSQTQASHTTQLPR